MTAGCENLDELGVSQANGTMGRGNGARGLGNTAVRAGA